MKRVRGHGKGNWVCAPTDFLDFGSRAAVDQAFSRLVRSGKLRRLGRGLYDLPRSSAVLKRLAPANLDLVIDAIARRDRIRIVPGGIAAANMLGLTTAVPAKADYLTDGAARTVKIGRRTIRLRRANPSVMNWSGGPAATVAQALRWLGPRAARDPRVIAGLRQRLPDDVKKALAKDVRYLPSWAVAIVSDIVGQRDMTA